MRRSRKILIKSIIIIFLSLAVWFSLTYYLPLKQVHIWYNYELTITRGILIGLLNTLFYGIVLVINIRAYRIIFSSLAFFGIVAWNISHLNQALDLGLLSNNLNDFLEIILFISTAVIAPGIVIFIAYYIKKYTSKFEGSFIGKYHLHEGFFGIILVGLAIVMFIRETVKSAMELGNPLVLDNFNDSTKKMAEGFMVSYKYWKQSSKLINFVKNQRTIDNFL